MSNVHFKRLVSDSLMSDANVRAATDAIDLQLARVDDLTDVPTVLARLDELGSDQLLHVATAVDAAVWREGWPIALKRKITKSAITDKRKKGTLLAVREAVKSIASAVKIVEWWQENPPAPPHTFKIEALLGQIEGVLETEAQDDLIALIDDAKPVRSHYTFTLIRTREARVGVTGAFRAVVYSRIRPVSVGIARATGSITAAVGVNQLTVMRSLVGRLK